MRDEANEIPNVKVSDHQISESDRLTSEWPTPTKDMLISVAALADDIERERYSRWPESVHIGEHIVQMSNFRYGDAMQTLHELVYKTKLIARNFDWGKWIQQAEHYMNNPDAVAQADLVTIQKLITAHFRGERFAEGHLESIHQSGHLSALLRRIAQLAIEMPDSE